MTQHACATTSRSWAKRAPPAFDGRPPPVTPDLVGLKAHYDDGWHRLHPLSPLIRAGRSLVAIVAVYIGTLAPGSRSGLRGVGGHLGVGIALLVAGVVSWLVTRWRVEDGDLRIESGLVRRNSQRFPLTQVQAIDIVRPALARLLGLAEVRLRMGGSTDGSGRLAYLGAGDANLVRTQLLALSRGLPEHTAEPSERVLVSVPTGRLVASILLSRPTLVAAALGVGLVVSNLLAPASTLPIISSSGAMTLGLLTMLWRRFNGNYRLTVADATDGLRLRSGLLETSSETIPRGRIQAVRMVEPLLWRPLGWCRLEVDVAGRQHRHGENSAEGRQLRAILPVGTLGETRDLLSLILPDAAADRSGPPARARLKSPLRYHYLAWGRNESCVVSTTGRVARTTSWVPMAKVQSLRLVQGPVQRALTLSTIYLDTAGRSVTPPFATATPPMPNPFLSSSPRSAASRARPIPWGQEAGSCSSTT
ncbi:MAG: PH domain-containing protein [Candidatus Dormibacteria bacterium]